MGGPASEQAPANGYHRPLARVGGLADGSHTVRVAVEDGTGDDQWAIPSGEASYEVYASRAPGFTPGPDTLVATTAATTFTHSRLGLAQTWYYRVRATDGEGAAGPLSREVSATTGSVLLIEAEVSVPPTEATAPYVVQSDCCGVHWSEGKQDASPRYGFGLDTIELDPGR